jgi:predicted RNA-binding Zn-ribbon protein involved in translation (DUF1610 family)
MQPSTCTNCGKPLREGIAFCPGCGSALATADASLESPAPVSASSSMAAVCQATCASCGNSLRERVAFCPSCGSAVVTAGAQAITAEAPTESDASPVPVIIPPTRAGDVARTEPKGTPASSSRSPGSRTPDYGGQAPPIRRTMPSALDPQTAHDQTPSSEPQPPHHVLVDVHRTRRRPGRMSGRPPQSRLVHKRPNLPQPATATIRTRPRHHQQTPRGNARETPSC